MKMVNKMEEIKLSVIIISYAQEKYIRDAIESVLSQKVNFKYELLLADDCSPDNTIKIMKEYEKKYPDIIKVLDRKKNLGATKNILDAASKSQGEYITVLEGDDYWCDNNKLQIQVDFLTKHPDYIGVSHLQEGRDLNNNFLGLFPKWLKKDRIITFENFEKGKDFSCSTCLYKNIYHINEYKNEIDYLLSLHRIVGDLQLCYFLLKHGNIYHINKPFMVYRVIKDKKASNYNSNNTVGQINLNNLNIISEIDKNSGCKHNFFSRYLNYITVGVCTSVLNKNFKNIKLFFSKCPNKFKFFILILIPFKAIKILIDRRR